MFKVYSIVEPYRVECTGSLPTSEVKRRRARLVLGWGTAREDLRVLSAFCHSRMWSGFGHRCYFLLFGGFGSQAGNSWLKPPQGDKTELTRGISVLHPIPGAEAITASQRSLHNAPIFRLLLKVAVNGTHQCDFLNF